MKNKIVADGYWRLRRGQTAVLAKSIEDKYAAELARAQPDEKPEIHQRMSEESMRRKKMADHNPSAGALW
jgi:hypothetical protein